MKLFYGTNLKKTTFQYEICADYEETWMLKMFLNFSCNIMLRNCTNLDIQCVSSGTV